MCYIYFLLLVEVENNFGRTKLFSVEQKSKTSIPFTANVSNISSTPNTSGTSNASKNTTKAGTSKSSDNDGRKEAAMIKNEQSSGLMKPGFLLSTKKSNIVVKKCSEENVSVKYLHFFQHQDS